MNLSGCEAQLEAAAYTADGNLVFTVPMPRRPGNPCWACHGESVRTFLSLSFDQNSQYFYKTKSIRCCHFQTLRLPKPADQVGRLDAYGIPVSL